MHLSTPLRQQFKICSFLLCAHIHLYPDRGRVLIENPSSSIVVAFSKF
jgi:hypothetical protein